MTMPEQWQYLPVQAFLVIKEWGTDVKVPGTIIAVSDVSYIKKTDDSDTVTINKESDSAAAPIAYIIYRQRGFYHGKES